jgi:hypothetical protein
MTVVEGIWKQGAEENIWKDKGHIKGLQNLTNNINVKIKKYEMGGHVAELKNHIYANYCNQKS